MTANDIVMHIFPSIDRVTTGVDESLLTNGIQSKQKTPDKLSDRNCDRTESNSSENKLNQTPEAHWEHSAAVDSNCQRSDCSHQGALNDDNSDVTAAADPDVIYAPDVTPLDTPLLSKKQYKKHVKMGKSYAMKEQTKPVSSSNIELRAMQHAAKPCVHRFKRRT